MRRFILARLFLSVGIAAAIIAPAPAEASFNPLSQAYQQVGSTNCTDQGDCAIVFPALPSKTIVTHVSCTYFLASGGVALNSYLTDENLDLSENVQSYAHAPSSSGTVYGINADVYVVYTKNAAPRVDVYSDGAPVQSFNCTISGFHS
ncbi:MAG TPA: hypothetical protein VM755_02510 [Stellaceae bacterium]|nr:hypothetical protein [Stellaceae bacterium]